MFAVYRWVRCYIRRHLKAERNFMDSSCFGLERWLGADGVLGVGGMAGQGGGVEAQAVLLQRSKSNCTKVVRDWRAIESN